MAWEALEQRAHHATTHDSRILREQSNRQYRERGLEFWEEFPKDPRRWQWLHYTVMQPPAYWSDLEQASKACRVGTCENAKVDVRARADWERRYVGLRAEFLSSRAAESRWQSLLWHELQSRLRDTDYAMKRNEEVNLAQLAGDALDFARTLKPNDSLMDGVLDITSRVADLMACDTELAHAFIAGVKTLPEERFHQLAIGLEARVALRNVPLELQLRAIDGKDIDFGVLRGKIVLLEFWSLGCSTCIAAMPGIREVYDRYRHLGFEVVGLCFENESQLPRVRTALEKAGANWPQSLQGSMRESALARRLGLTSPGYLLLDRNGLLIASDGMLKHPRVLERWIQNL